ncbi:MAG: TIGR02757 family protein [Bacteroidales bacterium]|nr:TIGR02757 family protein [Bacteroidales bacterium]
MDTNELKDFLEDKTARYQTPEFIETDPIQIPHLFNQAADIEVAGFLTATISWGQRKSILTNAKKLMQLMGHAPADFVLHANQKQLDHCSNFVHRTFNGTDLRVFLLALRDIYKQHASLGALFEALFQQTGSVRESIIKWRETFFLVPHQIRSQKHFANILKNASAKRINMFLRWMVRPSANKVDFGLWKKVPTSGLYIPLDLHTGNVARSLGLLTRKQNDWKAVEELTSALKTFDQQDPVKYDFALFGLGVF